MSRPPTSILLLAVLAGCGWPRPYTPELLAKDSEKRPHKALVHYLEQDGPLAFSVCDPNLPGGPHLARVDEATLDALMAGLESGRVPAEHWAGCLTAMWGGLDLVGRDQVAARVLETFTDLVLADVEDPEKRGRAQAVVRVIENRPADAHLPEEDGARSLERLAQADLGPQAKALAQRYRDAVEIGLGRWQGTPLTPERIGAMTEVEVLQRIVRRVPDATLSQAARKRVIDLRIDASPFPIVRERRAEVIAGTLQHGFWPLPEDFVVTAVHGADGGPSRLDVRQDPMGGWVGLSAATVDGSLGDHLDLADLFGFEVDGVGTVTTCWPSDGMDPTPCVPSSELHVDSPLASIQGGTLILAERLPADAARRLAGLATLSLPLTVRGVAGGVELDVWFVAPEPVFFVGDPGQDGPDLVLRVREETSGRLVFDVKRGTRTALAVVERSDLSRFATGSRGGAGIPGRDGLDGAAGRPGESGFDARCPDMRAGNGGMGGPGGSGEPGGNGGQGGSGGDVQVFLKCASDCGKLVAVLEQVVRSQAGRGGLGGEGGRGGQGGRGGSGGRESTCSSQGQPIFLPAGLDGASGPRGADGPDGRDGAHGVDGTVTLKVVP